MSVVVPQSVMEAVEEAAKRRRLSVPEFVEKALAAQSTAVLSDPYLEARAKRADGRGWRLLDEAPDAPPLPGDERPRGVAKRRSRSISWLSRQPVSFHSAAGKR